MAYKIKWARGGETAERYSTKKLGEKVLKQSNMTGKLVKLKLGDAGRTAPSTSFEYGDKKVKSYPKGRKRYWHKSPEGVYRTHVGKPVPKRRIKI